ncbi:MAG: amino acid deaminase [Microbacterium sp.]|jgi:D-serine deaminase-like pyridoxal phosphate-dependent protein|nr:amino acid deaminase [Microbacterium sp.]
MHVRLDLDEVDLPVLVLDERAVAANIDAMAQYCRAHGVDLAPHAKTHMSRTLVERQLAAGAWAMAAATPRQVRQLVEWKVPRILHANLAVDPAFISWIGGSVLRPDSASTYTAYVDSPASVALLETSLGRPDLPLPVLLEIGIPGGRTGVRDQTTAREVAVAVAASPALELVGVAAFEGLAVRTADEPPDAVPAAAERLLHHVHELVTALREAGLLPEYPVVTAGGSSYFDRVVELLGPQAWDRPVHTVLRSGCYVTHDHGMYRVSTPHARGADGPRFAPAFTFHARVLSAPEPGLALVGFGRRDAPTDERMPVVLTGDGEPHPTRVVTGVNDHHAFLRFPASDPAPRVGEVLSFGLSHPCGAFDRHREIPLLDDGLMIDIIHPHL